MGNRLAERTVITNEGAAGVQDCGALSWTGGRRLVHRRVSGVRAQTGLVSEGLIVDPFTEGRRCTEHSNRVRDKTRAKRHQRIHQTGFMVCMIHPRPNDCNWAPATHQTIRRRP